MSRLWNTPEYWARTEADELLQDLPSTDVEILAASFERSHDNYEGDPEFVRDIIAELKTGAAAALRFWPEPLELQSIDEEVRVALGGILPRLSTNEFESAGPPDLLVAEYAG